VWGVFSPPPPPPPPHPDTPGWSLGRYQGGISGDTGVVSGESPVPRREPPRREPPRRPAGPARTRAGAGAGTRAREDVTPAELDATATRHGGYALVARWVLDNPGMTTAQQRKLAKAVDELLAQRADPTLIPAALDEAHRPEWRNPVASLPHAYDRVRRDAHPPPPGPTRSTPRQSATQRAHAEVDAAVDAALGTLGYTNSDPHFPALPKGMIT
jgi:hypothetical protein